MNKIILASTIALITASTAQANFITDIKKIDKVFKKIEKGWNKEIADPIDKLIDKKNAWNKKNSDRLKKGWKDKISSQFHGKVYEGTFVPLK